MADQQQQHDGATTDGQIVRAQALPLPEGFGFRTLIDASQWMANAEQGLADDVRRHGLSLKIARFRGEPVVATGIEPMSAEDTSVLRDSALSILLGADA